MTLFAHLFSRRQLGLLAAGLLEEAPRRQTLAHLERCSRCRHELEELRLVVAALESDPLRTAEPDVALAVTVERVERGVERALFTPERRPTVRAWFVALPVAAAVLAVAVLVPGLVARFQGNGAPPVRAAIPPAEASPFLSEQELRTIERNLAREQAVRYLNQAGDVLVSVAASGADCERTDGRLDVGAAPLRSRELLEKRQLVETGGEAVASARGVLDEVEMALRDVAELPACVRRGDLDRVRDEVERRQLLMRIRLVTRELEG